VEDNHDYILDLDGWQDLIKDNEDAEAAREALQNYPTADIERPEAWARRQKSIKFLNRTDNGRLVTTETGIKGYYVPNPTGCARTERIVPISKVEKSKYLPHYIGKKTTQKIVIGDSHIRSCRIANRHLVIEHGISLHFNQLKNRTKRVCVDRSTISGWGLFTLEDIQKEEFVMEYLGEAIRGAVANIREAIYQRRGIRGTYMFTLKSDENPEDETIIDGTRYGNAARFINHSHEPNLIAKVIKHMNKQRIVFYALCDVTQGMSSLVNKWRKANGLVR
jgi:[histone H3]-lysine4 N-trimethyltransferase SETD1